jgi:hypothetical protein
MNKTITISVKLPEDVYAELVMLVPKGQRGSFIRDSIIKKLHNTPHPNKILELEKKIEKIETDFSLIKSYLADLEILTYERGKVNPHIFAIDKVDHDILNYLIHLGGATTPELAESLKVNRWLILNHLKRIQRLSKKQLGKPIIEYLGGTKEGKKRAWWLKRKIADVH